MRNAETIQREGSVSRVVEVVNSTPNGEQVRIRNLFEPLFVGMWQKSKGTLSAYHTDLCHDALALADSVVGDKLLWGYRESGTTLFRLNGMTDYRITANIAAMTNPLESYHLVQITKFRQNHADGYLTWLNCKSVVQLERIIRDNLPDADSI